MSDDVTLTIEVIIVTLAFATVIATSLYVVLVERRRFFAPNAYLSKLSDRVGYLERQRERDHAAMLNMALELEKWKAYSRLLALRLQAFTDDVPPPPEETAVTIPPDKRLTAQVLTALFNLDELDDLAFQLNIEPEKIGGDTRGKRARALVDYTERHGQLEELVKLARKLRPEGGI